MTTVKATFIALCAALVATACNATPIDPSEVPSISDYKDWSSIEVTGSAPGHGDTYRIIYYNDVVERYSGAGQYAVGSMIVKEIYPLDNGGPGALSYLGAMRKLPGDLDDVELQGGWLFTYVPADLNDEEARSTCWEHCHIQAPLDGAWYDYGM